MLRQKAALSSSRRDYLLQIGRLQRKILIGITFPPLANPPGLMGGLVQAKERMRRSAIERVSRPYAPGRIQSGVGLQPPAE